MNNPIVSTDPFGLDGEKKKKKKTNGMPDFRVPDPFLPAPGLKDPSLENLKDFFPNVKVNFVDLLAGKVDIKKEFEKVWNDFSNNAKTNNFGVCADLGDFGKLGLGTKGLSLSQTKFSNPWWLPGLEVLSDSGVKFEAGGGLYNNTIITPFSDFPQFNLIAGTQLDQTGFRGSQLIQLNQTGNPNYFYLGLIESGTTPKNIKGREGVIGIGLGGLFYFQAQYDAATGKRGFEGGFGLRK